MKLEVKEGCFGRKRGGFLFENVNFTGENGNVTAVLGVNGIGKSTLLKCICGLLKWSSGETCIDGRDIEDFGRRELWRIFGYVPQAAAQSSLTVGEAVLLGRTAGRSLLAQPDESDRQAAAEAMRLLGIDGLEDRPCSCISGGELQLTMLARALAAKPSVIILDEPETFLDIRNGCSLMKLIKSLAKTGMQVIFSTHDPQHALEAADHVLLFGADRKIYWGTTSDIMTKERLTQAYGVELDFIESNLRKWLVPSQSGAEV